MPKSHINPHVTLSGGHTWRDNRMLAVVPQGKAASVARASDGSLTLRARREWACEGETCQDPLWEGSAAGAISSCLWHWLGLSCSTLPEELLHHWDPHCHCHEQRKQILFWKFNLMLSIPCLHPGGTVWALVLPLLCSWFRIFASLLAQAQTIRVLLGAGRVVWKETSWQDGTGGRAPCILPCWLTRPWAG